MTIPRCAAFAAVLLVAAGARAENPKAAEKVAQGKRLLAGKRFGEACAAFQEAESIEHGLRSELGLAECNEGWGKLATAYDAYETAAHMAAASRDPREPAIRARITDLDPQVPRLTISVPKDGSTAGLVVTFDGAPLALTELGKERKVDPGPHQLEYKVGAAPGKSKLIPLERGGSSEITLELPEATEPGEGSAAGAGSGSAGASAGNGSAGAGSGVQRVPDVLPDGDTANAGHGRRVAGIVGMAAGVAGLGVSIGITVSARSKYRDALDAHCDGETNMCDAAGLASTHDARHEANIATIIASAGGVVAVAGLVVYLTAPRYPTAHGEHKRDKHKAAHDDDSDDEALRLVPTFAPGGGGVTLLGRF